MSLNIKNEEAHRLAQELAAMTGESMSAAVTEAIRERIDRVRLEKDQESGLAEQLMEIGRDIASRIPDRFKSEDHGDFLYDEYGLPKW